MLSRLWRLYGDDVLFGSMLAFGALAVLSIIVHIVNDDQGPKTYAVKVPADCGDLTPLKTAGLPIRAFVCSNDLAAYSPVPRP